MCLICLDFQMGYINKTDVESLIDDKSLEELKSGSHGAALVIELIKERESGDETE